ncbi:hypothetical protein HNP46_006367 [Pseudomonas nitritireducens]|uniref:Uncharacterized protein n=1 Tax=Pseudomonas nitroreducens TaxID=46680 RepID=A0A7W7P507_PSENT|nr:hypothetical protein [Pseudomonas nitritireducens]MBB4867454.1 hypothetical protein [Pseudomonas nitritireducens]
MLPTTPEGTSAETPSVAKKSCKQRLTRVVLLFVAVLAVIAGLGFAWLWSVEKAYLIGADTETARIGINTDDPFCYKHLDTCTPMSKAVARQGSYLNYIILMAHYRTAEIEKLQMVSDPERLGDFDFRAADSLMLDAVAYLSDNQLYHLLGAEELLYSEEARQEWLSSIEEKWTPWVKQSARLEAKSGLTEEEQAKLRTCWSKLDRRFGGKHRLIVDYVQKRTYGACSETVAPIHRASEGSLWEYSDEHYAPRYDYSQN